MRRQSARIRAKGSASKRSAEDTTGASKSPSTTKAKASASASASASANASADSESQAQLAQLVAENADNHELAAFNPTTQLSVTVRTYLDCCRQFGVAPEPDLVVFCHFNLPKLRVRKQ